MVTSPPTKAQKSLDTFTPFEAFPNVSRTGSKSLPEPLAAPLSSEGEKHLDLSGVEQVVFSDAQFEDHPVTSYVAKGLPRLPAVPTAPNQADLAFLKNVTSYLTKACKNQASLEQLKREFRSPPPREFYTPLNLSEKGRASIRSLCKTNDFGDTFFPEFWENCDVPKFHEDSDESEWMLRNHWPRTCRNCPDMPVYPTTGPVCVQCQFSLIVDEIQPGVRPEMFDDFFKLVRGWITNLNGKVSDFAYKLVEDGARKRFMELKSMFSDEAWTPIKFFLSLAVFYMALRMMNAASDMTIAVVKTFFKALGKAGLSMCADLTIALERPPAKKVIAESGDVSSDMIAALFTVFYPLSSGDFSPQNVSRAFGTATSFSKGVSTVKNGFAGFIERLPYGIDQFIFALTGLDSPGIDEEETERIRGISTLIRRIKEKTPSSMSYRDARDVMTASELIDTLISNRTRHSPGVSLHVLSRYRTELLQYRACASSIVSSKGTRIEPVGVRLCSVPGVGKTTMLAVLAARLDKKGRTPADRMYVDTAVVSFANGYRNQSFYCSDEFGAIKGAEHNKLCADLLQKVSVSDTNMNMAAVEDKSIMFDSHYVFLATNQSHTAVQSDMADPMAFERRFNTFRVYVQEPYALKDGKVNYDLVTAHIKEGILDESCYHEFPWLRFERYQRLSRDKPATVDTKPTLMETFTFNQFVVWAKAEHMIRVRLFELQNAAVQAASKIVAESGVISGLMGLATRSVPAEMPPLISDDDEEDSEDESETDRSKEELSAEEQLIKQRNRVAYNRRQVMKQLKHRVDHYAKSGLKYRAGSDTDLSHPDLSDRLELANSYDRRELEFAQADDYEILQLQSFRSALAQSTGAARDYIESRLTALCKARASVARSVQKSEYLSLVKSRLSWYHLLGLLAAGAGVFATFFLFKKLFQDSDENDKWETECNMVKQRKVRRATSNHRPGPVVRPRIIRNGVKAESGPIPAEHSEAAIPHSVHGTPPDGWDSGSRCEDAIMNKIKKNIGTLHHSGICNNVWFLCGDKMVTTVHTFMIAGDFLPEGTPITVEMGEHEVELAYSGHNLYCMQDSSGNMLDCCIYETGTAFDSFPDIRKYLRSENDSHVVGSGFLVARDSTRSLSRVKHMKKSVSYVSSDGQTIVTRMHYLYDPITGSGDCGSLLVCPSKGESHVILGHHCARYPGANSIAVSITREFMDEFLSNCKNEVLPTPELPKEVIPCEVDHNIPIGTIGVGKVKPSLVGNANRRTGYFKSPIYDEISEKFGLDRAPATLGVRSEHTKGLNGPSLMTKRLDRYSDQHKGVLNQKGHELAIAWKKKNIDEIGPGHSRAILTNEVALNGGRDGEWPNIRPYPFSTAGGIDGDRVNKTDCVSIRADGTKELLPEFEERLNLLEQQCADGTASCLFEVCLKDEILPMEKVLDNNTRTITVCPFIFNLLCKKHFGAYHEMMAREAPFSYSAIGIDVSSVEWSQMIEHLLEVSDVGFGGDYKGFESSHTSQAFDAVRAEYDHFYGDEPGSKTHRIRNALLRICQHAFIKIGASVHKTCASWPSGAWPTGDVNTMLSAYYILVAYFTLAARQSDDPVEVSHLTNTVSFSKLVRFKCMGDDHIIAVAPEISSWFNGSAVRAFLEESGRGYTPPDKDQDFGPNGKIVDIKFLSGDTIVMNPPPFPGWKYYYALMDPKYMVQLLWITKEAGEDALENNANSCLRAVWPRGKDFFTSLRKDILTAARNAKESIDLITFEDEYYRRKGIYDQAPVPESATWTHEVSRFRNAFQFGTKDYTRLFCSAIVSLEEPSGSRSFTLEDLISAHKIKTPSEIENTYVRADALCKVGAHRNANTWLRKAGILTGGTTFCITDKGDTAIMGDGNSRLMSLRLACSILCVPWDEVVWTIPYYETDTEDRRTLWDIRPDWEGTCSFCHCESCPCQSYVISTIFHQCAKGTHPHTEELTPQLNEMISFLEGVDGLPDLEVEQMDKFQDDIVLESGVEEQMNMTPAVIGEQETAPVDSPVDAEATPPIAPPAAEKSRGIMEVLKRFEPIYNRQTGDHQVTNLLGRLNGKQIGNAGKLFPSLFVQFLSMYNTYQGSLRVKVLSKDGTMHWCSWTADKHDTAIFQEMRIGDRDGTGQIPISYGKTQSAIQCPQLQKNNVVKIPQRQNQLDDPDCTSGFFHFEGSGDDTYYIYAALGDDARLRGLFRVPLVKAERSAYEHNPLHTEIPETFVLKHYPNNTNVPISQSVFVDNFTPFKRKAGSVRGIAELTLNSHTLSATDLGFLGYPLPVGNVYKIVPGRVHNLLTDLSKYELWPSTIIFQPGEQNLLIPVGPFGVTARPIGTMRARSGLSYAKNWCMVAQSYGYAYYREFVGVAADVVVVPNGESEAMQIPFSQVDTINGATVASCGTDIGFLFDDVLVGNSDFVVTGVPSTEKGVKPIGSSRSSSLRAIAESGTSERQVKKSLHGIVRPRVVKILPEMEETEAKGAVPESGLGVEFNESAPVVSPTIVSMASQETVSGTAMTDKQKLERPAKIDTITWSESEVPHSVLWTSVAPWGLIHGVAKHAIESWHYMQAGIKVRVNVQSHPNFSGLLRLSWLPLRDDPSEHSSHVASLVDMSICPHADIRAGENSVVELTIPYNHPKAMVSLHDAITEIPQGTLSLVVINQLRTGTESHGSVQLSMFVNFEDVTLRVIRPIAVPESGFFSGLGSNIKKVAKSMIDVTEATASVVGLFQDKPNDGQSPPVVTQGDYPYLSNATGVEQGQVMALYPDASVDLDAGSGAVQDETTYDYLFSVWCMFRQSSISSSDGYDHIIMKGNICPLQLMPSLAVGDICQEPLLGYVTSAHTYWSGPIELKFTFTGTIYTKARMTFAYHYGSTSDEQVGDMAVQQYSVIYDYDYANPTLVVQLPWIAQTDQLRVPSGSEVRVGTHSSGQWSLRVDAPLVAPDSVADHLDVNLSIRGGPGFKVSGVYENINDYRIVPIH